MLLCALSLSSLSNCVPQSKAQGPVASGHAASASAVDMNLRITWSATQQRYWQIRIAVADSRDAANSALAKSATISQIVNRCESLAAPGSFQYAADGTAVTFTPREPLMGGEFDFRWQSSPATRISVQVHSDAKYTRPPASPSDPAWNRIAAKLITADELVAGEPVSELDDSGQPAQTDNWSITRNSEDRIRIEGLSDAGFTEITGTFSCSVRVNSLTEWASDDLILVYELRQASTGRVVSEKRWPLKLDAGGNSVSVDIDEPSPAVAGVYEIHCRLQKDDDHLLMRLRRRTSLVAAASLPLLVTVPVSKDKDQATAQAWQKIARIRPASDSEWELNQWLPSSSKRLIRRIDPRESSRLERSEHAGQAISVLQPGAEFIASLPSRQASLPHKITIQYPAGKQISLGVEIDSAEDFKQPSRKLLITGDPHLGGNETWRSHTFVHYPSGSEEFIRVSNQSEKLNAEFASITVEAGGARLAADVDKQKPTSRLAALKVSGFAWVQQLTGDLEKTDSLRELNPSTQALHRFVVAAERLLDYAAAAGFNAVVIDSCHGDRAWFDSEHWLANRKANRFAGRHLESLLRTADASSIRVVVGVELSMQLSRIESEMLADKDSTGMLRRCNGSTVRYNPQHALVHQHLSGLLTEIHQAARAHDSYAGLVLNCSQNTHLSPLAPHQLDITTLQSFANSATQVAMTTSQLHAWIQNEGRHPMLNWLRERSRQMYETLTENIDQDVYLQMHGQSVLIDSDAKAKNSITLIDLRRDSSLPLDNETSHSIRSPSQTAKPGRATAVILGERAADAKYAKSFITADAQKDLTDVLVGLDPQVLLIDDTELTLALSPAIQKTLVDFSALPNSPLRGIAGVDAETRTVRVRLGREGLNLALVISNLAPWPSEVEVDLAANLNWTDASRGLGGISEEHSRWRIERGRLSASLRAGETIALAATAPSAEVARLPIRAWSSRVSGGLPAMADIKNQVTAVVERIGILSDPQTYEQLSNGGFEKSGGVGIPGWMHTQYPPTAVRIDDAQAIAGSRSVVLTNSQGTSSRAWLVSETIAPPVTGRLAVSLATRAESASGDAKHHLRVSIEGIRGGQPFRQSAELEIPRDGQWQPRKIVLEARGLDPANVDAIRLTIDSLSSGRVWIDEIHLHDWFPTTSERGELQAAAFLAVQGLQRGNVTPAARLLRNYWAQYLIDQKELKHPDPVMQTTEQQEEPVGMAERIKSWLPRPLRF